MEPKRKTPEDIDAYISQYPEDIQALLEKLRTTVREAAPDAEEAMSYGMPTFRLAGNLVHFAAFKNHIGFYPTPTGTAKFRKELARYAGAKGSVRFPLDEPMPFELIRKIVAFRVKENLARAKAKK